MVFSLEELKSLAMELGSDWDRLPGKDESAKTLSLVSSLADHGRLADLLTFLADRKPEANLHVFPLVFPDSQEAPATESVSIENEVFQQYVAQITSLLHERNLFEADSEDQIWRLFESRTLDAFAELDGKLKGQLLRFLHDTKIVGDTGLVNVGGARLDTASLKGEDLNRANFAGANLGRANFAGAKLEGANLRGANLGGADLWGAILTGADLSQAHLWGANLNKAVLRQADLSGARLSNATLWGADLTNANLDSAYLWGANLESAILRGARNITERQLELAQSLAGMIMPDGRRRE